MTDRAAEFLRKVPRAAVLVSILGVANAVIWGLLTPIWQTPDEWAHVAYVQSVAERGRVPDRNSESDKAVVSSEQKLALEETVSFTVVSFLSLKPVWSAEDERRWERLNASREPARDDGGGYTTIAAHPFLYYLVQAPVYEAGASASIISRVQLMRALSALMAGMTAFFTWLLIDLLFTGPKWLPTTGSLCVAFMPMMGFMGGAVNNDIFAALLGTVLIYLLVRSLRRKLTLKLGLAVSMVLGLGILTKGNLLALVPVVGLTVVFIFVRYRQRLRDITPGLAGLVLGGVGIAVLWVLLNAVLGSGSSGGGPSVKSTQLSGGVDIRGLATYVWNFYLPNLGIFPDIVTGVPAEKPVYTLWIVRFFANFGWIDVFLPAWVYRVIAGSMAIIAIVSLYAAAREWRVVRRRIPEIVVCLAAIPSVTLLIHALYYPGFLGAMAEQGRYLLPVIGVFGVGMAGACLALGRRYGRIVAALLVSAMLALNAESLVVTALRYYT